ncbi:MULTISPECIES: molybdopterin-dependent oxidoreductase [unclassified Janthinobacterium]|uniref:molybdopterin-dependent oxidoreductase n=1 Tax=unclassified Janthinobacterium TaxID=2610881 RepID=UPI000348DFB8|nr:MULTISPECIES: molybdopterin-dependent oxidoreductase [unclassified Janthinobacterium]MEC5161940.1 DMSO/TMAO reductase YedYZ molybdopterin-dependent catalytic subunit [Janthinobacterium sp. CG_S6]
MMSSIFRTLTMAGALAACAPGCAHDATAPAAASPSVTVSGAVERKLTLRADDLRGYPPRQISELQLAGRDGADAGKPVHVRGVRLRDILEQAQVVTRDHHTVKKLAVIATAGDGYKVIFSWSELFNSQVGDDVLVLFERDGKPLGADEGPLALISGKDKRTGPRHVKWLQAIEVRQIVE